MYTPITNTPSARRASRLASLLLAKLTLDPVATSDLLRSIHCRDRETARSVLDDLAWHGTIIATSSINGDGTRWSIASHAASRREDPEPGGRN